MRWSRKSRGSSRGDAQSPTGLSLVDEVLKNEGRYRSRPQAPSQAQLLLPPVPQPPMTWPKSAPVEFEHDGGRPQAGPAHVQARVVPGARDGAGNAVGAWRIGWDGRTLTFGSATTAAGEWRTRAGGVLPECRGKDSGQARVEPGSDAVAEIAALADSRHVFGLLLLNERAQRLASLQVLGFDEPRLVDFAGTAGLHYRRYRVDDQSWWALDTYFPARYRDAIVFRLSETEHVVKLESWIRGGTRIQPDF